MHDRHLYIVSYDISDPKRWRRIFKKMKGYGRHLQLSVFQCDLTPMERVQLAGDLEELIHQSEDQVIILDLGLSRNITVQMACLGRPDTPHQRGPTIV